MRALHVITGLGTGGAETVLCRLLEALQPPAFEHTVVSLAGEGDMSSRVRDAGATLVALDMQPGRPSARALWNLRRVLRAAQPDIIHAWMYHANLMATLAAAGTGIPVLWGIRQSLYDLQREKASTRLVIRAGQLLSGRPARIIYNSSTSAAQHAAFGFRSARSRMIPNGFDTARFRADAEARARVRSELSIAPDALAIGLIARWHPMKDHANFLHAAESFAHSHPHVVFVLVGDRLESTNTDLMTSVNTLGLTDRMRLCGRRTDIPEVNVALDIASSSSWGEAFPNAIGEAMACEVPCVATDVGDVRDIIGNTGVVVPPRDPRALSDGWGKLARLSEADRRTAGARARRRILDTYSLTAMASRYAAVYAAATGEH